jgi:hypothetical protein
MESSIDRALNLGFGFILFVLALSIFMTMNHAIIDYSHVAEVQFKLQDKLHVVEATTSIPIVSKAYLFHLLTDSDHLGKGLELNQVRTTYRVDDGLEIYINGVQYPVVTDYMGIKSLTMALQGITSNAFQVREQVNFEGRVVGIYYTGQ